MRDFILLHPRIFSTVFVIGVALYLLALLNRLIFLRKNYQINLRNLEQQKKSEIAMMNTKMINDGTARYASKTAEGIVSEVAHNANERIARLKIEYCHDYFKSIISCITDIFNKRV